MKIDDEMMEKIARLANIKLTEEEKKEFEKDFQEILEYFKVLDEVDVDGVKSSFRPIEIENSLREDIPKPSLSVEDAQKFTENKKDGFFIGPRSIE